MAKQPDYDELARSFLDLWQDQASRLARDPEMRALSEQWMAMFMPFLQPARRPEQAEAGPEQGFAAGYGPGGSARSGRAQSEPGGGARDEAEGSGERDRSAASARPEAVAAVPDDRDAELERLTARIRELEERIAGLESRSRSNAGGAGAAPERQRRGDSRKRR